MSKLPDLVLRPAALALLLALGFGLVACDRLLTTAPDGGDLFDSPIDGLSPAELAAFVEGDAQFGRPFSPVQGLGPIFNNVSCASCHSGDGRGRPENALTRFSRGTDLALDEGGPQLQNQAIPGAEAEALPAGVDHSLRLPPPVFGVGLIEAIPEADIVALEDPDDLNGDGISGRANRVAPPAFLAAHGSTAAIGRRVGESRAGGGGALVLGRFSRKAQVASIFDQTVAAYHQDIGITTEFLPVENHNPLASVATTIADRVADPELGTPEVLAVVGYLRMLAPPTPGPLTGTRPRGREVFATVGCAGCHVPSFRTGSAGIPALSNRPVELYSDLLLHDMGEELADHRPDGDANGFEWRTAPLWGTRVMREFLNGQAFLLHDGRARSVAEAISAHGGEAAASRDAYRALSEADRAALIDFVESR